MTPTGATSLGNCVWAPWRSLAKDIHIGAKVTKGALVAQVEVLGIPTEVRALHGGIVVTLKAATGDPVEYGQEIFLLESIGEVAK